MVGIFVRGFGVDFFIVYLFFLSGFREEFFLDFLVVFIGFVFFKLGFDGFLVILN